jgi:uncharacterized protein (DUF2141 family)
MIRARFLGKPMSLFTVLLLLFTVPVPAQSPNSATLTIHIVNARNANGVIRVALFYSPEGFPGDASKALRTQPAKIDPQTLNAQAVFSGVPQGTYAVMVFHDENNNGKLDKNMIGIPKEVMALPTALPRRCMQLCSMRRSSLSPPIKASKSS